MSIMPEQLEIIDTDSKPPLRPDQAWLVLALILSAIAGTMLATAELTAPQHRLLSTAWVGVWIVYVVLHVGEALKRRIDQLAKTYYDAGYLAGVRGDGSGGSVVPLRPAR